MKALGTSIILLFATIWLHAQIDGFAAAPELHSSVKVNVGISGEVHNSGAEQIQFSFFKDYVSFAEEIKTVPINDKAFGLTCLVEHPHIAKLTIDGQEIQLFLKPESDLKLSIDKDCTTQFEGGLSEENNFLLSFNQAFGSWKEEAVLFEIKQEQPTSFRQKMDKIRLQKLSFLQDYPLYEEFDSSFTEYITAEINYWWAYYLLKYREINQRENPAKYKKIPNSFYSFLRKVEISNDKGFMSHYYVDFLESYLRFRQNERIDINKIWVSRNSLKTTKPTALYKQPVGGEPVVSILKGGNLIYENQFWPEELEVEPSNLNDSLWLQVRTESGKRGYVKASDVSFIASAYAERGRDANNRYQSTVAKIELYLKMTKDNVPVYDDPYKPNSVGSKMVLSKGKEVKYSLVKTADAIPIIKSGDVFYDHFYKIQFANNKVGWVPAHMVRIVERKVKAVGNTQFLSPLTITSDAGKYLNGRAYFYMLARALFWRMRTEPLENLGIDIANFKAENTDEEFEKIVRSANDLAQLRKKGDAKTLANYEYSVIKNILIQGTILSPFEKKEKISRQEIVELPKIEPSQKRSTIRVDKLQSFTLTLYQDFIFNRNMKKENVSSLEVTLEQPTFGLIKKGEERVPIYLEEDKDLIVIKDKSWAFTSDLGPENAFLYSYTKSFKAEIKEVEGLVDGEDISAFHKANLSLLKEQERYLIERSQGLNNIGFLELLKLEAKGAFGSRYLKVLEEASFSGTAIKPSDLQEIEQYLGGISQGYDGQVFGPDFASFLMAYDEYNVEKMGSERTKARRNLYPKRAFYLLEASRLALLCKQGKATESGKDIRTFMEQCPVSSFNQLLSDVYYEEVGFAAGAEVPNFELLDHRGKKWKLSDLRGKVVYIDFWATWCTPCLRSISYAQKLVQEFKDKEVVFLFISMDQDKGIWDKFLVNQPMDGVQLHFKSNGFQDIEQKFKVKNLPTYYLVDKSGKIPFAKTYSPGSPFLADQINKLLANPQ